MHDNEMGMGCKCEGDCTCENKCGCAGGMRHGKHIHRAIRMLTAVIVIIFIFWCGFEFGEMRAMVGFGRGYGMMQNQGYENSGYGMMRYTTGSATVTNTAAVPAGPIQTSPTGPNLQ